MDVAVKKNGFNVATSPVQFCMTNGTQVDSQMSRNSGHICVSVAKPIRKLARKWSWGFTKSHLNATARSEIQYLK